MLEAAEISDSILPILPNLYATLSAGRRLDASWRLETGCRRTALNMRPPDYRGKV